MADQLLLSLKEAKETRTGGGAKLKRFQERRMEEMLLRDDCISQSAALGLSDWLTEIKAQIFLRTSFVYLLAFADCFTCLVCHRVTGELDAALPMIDNRRFVFVHGRVFG
jgi:hypothetical protein